MEVHQVSHSKGAHQLVRGAPGWSLKPPEQARLTFPQFQSWEPEAQRGWVEDSGCTARRTGPSPPWGDAHGGAEMLSRTPLSSAPGTQVARQDTGGRMHMPALLETAAAPCPGYCASPRPPIRFSGVSGDRPESPPPTASWIKRRLWTSWSSRRASLSLQKSPVPEMNRSFTVPSLSPPTRVSAP